MKKTLMSVLVVVISLLMVAFIGVTGCKTPATNGTAETAGETASGEPVTLKYLCTSEIQELMLQAVVSDFTEKTGINVEMEILGFDEGVSKMKLEASKGSDTYDLWCHHTYNHAPFYYNGWVANLDELQAEYGIDLRTDDMFGTVEVLGSLDGVTYGMPFLLAMMGALQYRTDMFEDPTEMEAFKAKYGYDLAPPTNWDQYYDVSEFFTRDTDGDGEIDFWGNSSVLDAGGSIYDMWLTRYLGNVMPDDASATYNYLFTEDLQPRFNSEAGIKAIEGIAKEYQAGYLYPGSLSMNWPQCVEPLSNNQSGMSYMWAETILPAMSPENNPYADVSWWAPVPYDTVDRMEIGGWVQMINAKTKHPKEALMFLEWCSSTETEYKMITETDYWKVPFREENRNKDEIFKGFEFYRIPLHELDTRSEVLPELFLPEVDVVQIPLNTELQRIVLGEKDAKTGLDDAAEAIIKGLEEAGAYERIGAK